MTAERYWEGRWRDEKAENERLRQLVLQYEAEIDRLRKLIDPFRVETLR